LINKKQNQRVLKLLIMLMQKLTCCGRRWLLNSRAGDSASAGRFIFTCNLQHKKNNI